MEQRNNLKKIRELYGATQEQIAQALEVNRVTVANWENGTAIPSRANREKLSIYYDISQEFFYDLELTAAAEERIKDSGERERAVVAETNGKRNKQEEFQRLFKDIDFHSLLDEYAFFAKLLLAKADDVDLDSLRTALTVHNRIGRRLNSIVSIREEEAEEEPNLPQTQSILR